MYHVVDGGGQEHEGRPRKQQPFVDVVQGPERDCCEASAWDDQRVEHVVFHKRQPFWSARLGHKHYHVVPKRYVHVSRLDRLK